MNPNNKNSTDGMTGYNNPAKAMIKQMIINNQASISILFPPYLNCIYVKILKKFHFNKFVHFFLFHDKLSMEEKKMVTHIQLFIDSLFQPKKLAAYRVLPIGKVIQYVFILIAIVTIFAFIQFLTGVSETAIQFKGLRQYVKDIQWLLYPFALFLLFFTSTVLLFVRISIYAAIGALLLKLLKRRGEYRHMWRTTAFAITWSTLLSILFSFLSISSWVATMVSSILTIVLLIFASLNYPKLAKSKF